MKADFQIKGEIRSLTAFRFFAAFFVFLFHLEIRSPVFGDGVLHNFIAEGAVGMTLFFVLSGFILSHAYHAIQIDLRAYFWNRFARIYPIYFLSAFLSLPWLAKDISLESVATSLPAAAAACILLLVLGILCLQAWLPQAFPMWNNSASWSISNEVFFYSLFPYLRSVIQGFGIRSLCVSFVLLSLLSSSFPASAFVFSKAVDSFAFYYANPFFRLPEFICGIIAYHLMVKVQWTGRLRFLLIFLVFAGFSHVAILGRVLPGFTLHNWIFIPAVSACLVLLYKVSATDSRSMAGGIFVWLGRISYCFYSFQFHVLEGVKYLAPVENIGAFNYAVVSTLVLLVVSAIAHHLVEEPARIWLRQRTAKNRPTIGAFE